MNIFNVPLIVLAFVNGLAFRLQNVNSKKETDFFNKYGLKLFLPITLFTFYDREFYTSFFFLLFVFFLHNGNKYISSVLLKNNSCGTKQAEYIPIGTFVGFL